MSNSRLPTGWHASIWLALLVAIVCTFLALDRWLPPSVERARNTSTLALDSDQRILRAFTTPPGVWRLPARPKDVDPLYLTMLAAYEDQRFATHSGVDPLAVTRALGQWLRHGRV
ncbi:MAG: transglycosylase domain-containing protein, partial [Candidatus Competibacter sp.]